GSHPQRYHYMWSEEASLFQIVLLSGHPCAIHEQTWVTPPEDVHRWLQSQYVKWTLMDRMECGEMLPWASDIHTTKYGACEFTEFCLHHGQNELLLPSMGYVKRMNEVK
ncbi:MAG: hypothetical protein ACRCZI_00240, partial [Cetobacterium sp.]